MNHFGSWVLIFKSSLISSMLGVPAAPGGLQISRFTAWRRSVERPPSGGGSCRFEGLTLALGFLFPRTFRFREPPAPLPGFAAGTFFL